MKKQLLRDNLREGVGWEDETQEEHRSLPGPVLAAGDRLIAVFSISSLNVKSLFQHVLLFASGALGGNRPECDGDGNGGRRRKVDLGLVAEGEAGAEPPKAGVKEESAKARVEEGGD